jgi:hypothetical protein
MDPTVAKKFDLTPAIPGDLQIENLKVSAPK